LAKTANNAIIYTFKVHIILPIYYLQGQASRSKKQASPSSKPAKPDIPDRKDAAGEGRANPCDYN
jgi:hypothetical protein